MGILINLIFKIHILKRKKSAFFLFFIEKVAAKSHDQA